jgi:hypothetical protein
MDSSIIIKLLAHHLQEDGRTLVALSGVNLLWRKLLKREPDGALFCFCKKACERVFPEFPNPVNCISLFYFHLQRFSGHMNFENVVNALILKDAPQAMRIELRPRIYLKRESGQTFFTITHNANSWNYDVTVDITNVNVWREYYNYIWTGKTETLYFEMEYYRPSM